MINFNLIKKATRYRLEEVAVDKIVNGEFVKALRDKLNMSQNVFADAMGVTNRTVIKWEKGKIKGAASRLLYLLDKDPLLIKRWYNFGKVDNDTNQVINFLDNVYLKPHGTLRPYMEEEN
jgi:DNA-binding transcriptional regulator YiaG